MNVFNFRIQVFVTVREVAAALPGTRDTCPGHLDTPGQGWEPSGDGASLGTGAGAGIL